MTLSAECRHHWVIAPPNGPTSPGKCKRCGAEKTFSNTPIEKGPFYEVHLAPDPDALTVRPVAKMAQKRRYDGRFGD